MNGVEKSLVEQSIALLNDSFVAEDQRANEMVKDAISRLEQLLELIQLDRQRRPRIREQAYTSF